MNEEDTWLILIQYTHFQWDACALVRYFKWKQTDNYAKILLKTDERENHRIQRISKVFIEDLFILCTCLTCHLDYEKKNYMTLKVKLKFKNILKCRQVKNANWNEANTVFLITKWIYKKYIYEKKVLWP